MLLIQVQQEVLEMSEEELDILGSSKGKTIAAACKKLSALLSVSKNKVVR